MPRPLAAITISGTLQASEDFRTLRSPGTTFPIVAPPAVLMASVTAILKESPSNVPVVWLPQVRPSTETVTFETSGLACATRVWPKLNDAQPAHPATTKASLRANENGRFMLI